MRRIRFHDLRHSFATLNRPLLDRWAAAGTAVLPLRPHLENKLLVCQTYIVVIGTGRIALIPKSTPELLIVKGSSVEMAVIALRPLPPQLALDPFLSSRGVDENV